MPLDCLVWLKSSQKCLAIIPVCLLSVRTLSPETLACLSDGAVLACRGMSVPSRHPSWGCRKVCRTIVTVDLFLGLVWCLLWNKNVPLKLLRMLCGRLMFLMEFIRGIFSTTNQIWQQFGSHRPTARIDKKSLWRDTVCTGLLAVDDTELAVNTGGNMCC